MEILGQSTKTTTPVPYTHLGYVAACGRDTFWMPLIPGVILLIVGSLQLHFRKERHRKASIAAIIGGLLFVSISIAFYFDKPNIPSDIKTRVNYYALSTALSLYAQDNNGNLPIADQWCDLLFESFDMDRNPFSLDDLRIGECAYAMNKNVVDVKLEEIPLDVVLLFETGLGIEEERTGSFLSRQCAKNHSSTNDHKVFKNRWNQVGGPEDIKTDYHHRPGANVLFGDGRVEFVPQEEIDSLKWTVEDSETTVGPTKTE